MRGTITATELRLQLRDAGFEREPRTIQRLLETLFEFYDKALPLPIERKRERPVVAGADGPMSQYSGRTDESKGWAKHGP